MSYPTPIFLAGPTAVGKTDSALILADRLGGELISVDSMQVYCGMDIGTAKPTPVERRGVTHHLIDVVGLTESFNAAEFVALAQKAKDEIQSRDRVPIFSGGTGLYFQACFEGVGEAPGADWILREELENKPMADLLDELEKADPKLLETIDRQNRRRLVRAVEVIRLTGRSYSRQRSDWQQRSAGNGHAVEKEGERRLFFGLERDREDLNARIDKRVDQMFERGLVAETEALLKLGLERNSTARQALGYRQVSDYLRGERSLEQTVALVKQRTRQYAKRQMTWFRRQKGLAWVHVLRDETAETVARKLIALVDQRRISCEKD